MNPRPSDSSPANETAVLYLDNAATAWPKPATVLEAMARYMRDVGASPGRSGHRLANDAERIRFDAREAVAALLGVTDPTRIVFTLNGTMALNIALHGLLGPGDHVVTTGMEHNAVMRPLTALAGRGVSMSVAECAADGTLEPDAVAAVLQPQTRVIVANHASNVCGTVLPIREIGKLARERGVVFLVDAAQTAGCWPIDLAADHIDLLAFTGHKSLMGPSGTGGLAIADGFDVDRLPPLLQGGTGSRSEREEQPTFLPDKYEAGTPNTVGLAGLVAGVRWVQERGLLAIRQQAQVLAQRLIDGLRVLAGVQVQGTLDAARQTAVVSFTVAGQSPGVLAQKLDERYGIMVRPGLHCAPRAHRTLGTSPDGTVRLAPGPANTPAEMDRAVAAVAELVREGTQ
ncbi:MAG: aminotransferase class V-fold PLP-dependent enzyme [Phycisphaerae bacterium]|jgi:cysteine desulfurase family protein